ncbi:hypothetical protein Rrhod_0062 [Rhodococcus rhodnii LMG 5362]|uniref:Uncharacterized protein n=1 Tax=Rhodococcus rhodnii LMG 5362 TaxID=1273125 RepID=R7WTC4_9NOCA|nr:hypothetical protein Rrhod_0062 [Rhodococcus rhodnii LMG 5362]
MGDAAGARHREPRARHRRIEPASRDALRHDRTRSSAGRRGRTRAGGAGARRPDPARRPRVLRPPPCDARATRRTDDRTARPAPTRPRHRGASGRSGPPAHRAGPLDAARHAVTANPGGAAR